MSQPMYIAFQGDQRIAEGDLRTVARLVKQAADTADGAILVFNAQTSQPIEIDLRGKVEDVLSRLPSTSSAAPADAEEPSEAPRRGPGRPKLGVVAREITLLPRHWDWLAMQPGGASVAIRKLVEDARKVHGARDRKRSAREAAYRFASVMAGNRPHYEDAIRALFADDQARFAQLTDTWPVDVRDHARRLSDQAFNES
ncbi:DUF2239 family protein [Bradyrhizobium prioriisuperbiae]|uniref:DUF2239 family protein n=1 Tax=Bradyrhizobium prioriisuperbiae TaxID=2854389 RepID=UPI0028EC648F|nr:DUF2239 family protein [Bradyrhizobium prioritasuperba]